MRYIAIGNLQPDNTWLQSADAAEQAAYAAPPAQRSKVINDRGQVWGDLKEKLRELSYGKCWYCESVDARSDNAVDHYRPKGNVKGSKPPHGGYWWLAFRWRNYRFACTFCNSIRINPKTSGGKADYFPLADESRRAIDDQHDIDDEAPLLLDPTNPLDVTLIAFADDGSVGPAFNETEPVKREMATVSIERYHLMHPYLTELRAKKLKQVRGWIDEADKHLERHNAQGSAAWRQSARARIEDVLRAASPQADYSSAVRHLIAGMATKSTAARTVLNSL